jgi:hypothetical protein
MRLRIETERVPSSLLVEYAAILIAFEVASVLSARDVADKQFVLTESSLDSPYVENYDALGDGPLHWAMQFDTSQWALLLARAEGRSLGGATVAFRSSQLDILISSAGSLSHDVLRSRAHRWMFLNYFRNVAGVLAYVALMLALVVP